MLLVRVSSSAKRTMPSPRRCRTISMRGADAASHSLRSSRCSLCVRPLEYEMMASDAVPLGLGPTKPPTQRLMMASRLRSTEELAHVRLAAGSDMLKPMLKPARKTKNASSRAATQTLVWLLCRQKDCAPPLVTWVRHGCVSDGAAHAPPAAAPAAGTSRTKHHRTEGVCPPGCTSFIIRSAAPPITAYLRLDVSGRSCLSCCCFAKLNAGSNNTRAVFAPARAERKANSLSRSTRAAPLMSVSIGGGGAMGAAVQQSLSTLPGAGAPPAPPPGYSAAVDAFRAAQRELQVRRGSKRGALARGPPASAPTSRAHPTPRCSWQLRPSRACARKKMRATWSARCVSAGGAAMRGTAQPRALRTPPPPPLPQQQPQLPLPLPRALFSLSLRLRRSSQRSSPARRCTS